MSNRDLHEDYERDIALREQPEELKEPPKFKVIMHNDDYTPMDFVVEILMRYFAMDEAAALATMMRVHTEGSAVAGVYSRDVAETKAHLVNETARAAEHPLLCNIEASE